VKALEVARTWITVTISLEHCGQTTFLAVSDNGDTRESEIESYTKTCDI
jgi:hypothetical protein